MQAGTAAISPSDAVTIYHKNLSLLFHKYGCSRVAESRRVELLQDSI